MAYTVPTVEPTEARIGATYRFKRYYADYLPESGWTLTHVLVSASAQIELTGTDNGDSYHLIEALPAVTELWVAGTYTWQSSVTDGTDVYQVGTSTIELLPDLVAASSGYDTRSHVKKTLDALEALLEGRATKDQQGYAIGNRSISRMDIGELLKWRDRYRSLYQQELRAAAIASGIASSNLVRVRF